MNQITEINNHSKKHRRSIKIRSFFFEFFMMFLAITGGFFMENLREDYVERKKEKEYIESMVKDMKLDTSSIQNILVTYEKQIKGIDSLKQVLQNPVEHINYSKMYRLTLSYLNSLIAFEPNTITITQLKNSGGLRLISNKTVSDSIVNYYSTYDSHVEQQQYTMRFLQETLQLEITSMDFMALNRKPVQFHFDQNKFKEFCNRSLLFQSLLENELLWMKDYQQQSISMLNFLTKEYKFNN